MEVEFKKATYRARLFAFAVDLFLMVVTTLGFMGLSFLISTNFSYYKSANKTINDLQFASHLYVERSDGTAQLMCDYYRINDASQYETYNKQFDEALIAFYTDPAFFNQEDPSSGIYLYNIQKIPNGQTSSELFIYEDSSHTKIIPQSSATAEQLYKFYSDAMSKQAVTYLTNQDAYIEASKIINLNFIFVELLIPIVLSVLIYELIIPLCFKRGKKTIGKLIFKLGVVDVHGLSCSWPRYLARFSIFLFLEIIFSIPGLLIPIIVSFSMCVFSKRGQALHDYVTNTYVVEGASKSICLNEKEYLLKHQKDQEFVLNKEDIILP